MNNLLFVNIHQINKAVFSPPAELAGRKDKNQISYEKINFVDFRDKKTESEKKVTHVSQMNSTIFSYLKDYFFYSYSFCMNIFPQLLRAS